MSSDQFNIGANVVFDVVTSDGTTLNLPITVTGFHMKAEYTRITSKTMSALNLEASLPTGWRGTITLDRRDNTVDAFFAALEAAFFAAQVIKSVTVTETISEFDGTQSRYQYTKGSLSFDDAGDKQGEKKIEQTIGVFASRRKQLA